MSSNYLPSHLRPLEQLQVVVRQVSRGDLDSTGHRFGPDRPTWALLGRHCPQRFTHSFVRRRYVSKVESSTMARFFDRSSIAGPCSFSSLCGDRLYHFRIDAPMTTDPNSAVTNITNPRLIYCKGLLFLIGGCLAAGLLLFYSPSLKIAALLAISIWCFSRFYYFAFYVIQHYVDGNYRFSGLFSFFAYVIRQRLGWKYPHEW